MSLASGLRRFWWVGNPNEPSGRGLSREAVGAFVDTLPQFLVPLVAVTASWAIHATLDGAPRAARMVPDVICVVVALLAIVQIFVTSIALLRRIRGAPRATDSTPLEERAGITDVALQGVIIALMVAFVPAVQAFGFLLPSLVFIALVGILSGDKVLPALLLSAVIVATVLGGMSAAGFYYPLW